LTIIDIPNSLVIPHFAGQQNGHEGDALPAARRNVYFGIFDQPAWQMEAHLKNLALLTVVYAKVTRFESLLFFLFLIFSQSHGQQKDYDDLLSQKNRKQSMMTLQNCTNS